jgi:glycosyltransferase involved in cell wall biosynthesis
MKYQCSTTLLIDGRFIGHSGLGRYTQSMIAELVNFDLEITVIINDENQKAKLPNDLRTILFEAKPFKPKEQFEFFKIKKKFDIFWSPHFNIPMLKKLGNKEYVTFHDFTPLRPESGLTVSLFFLLSMLVVRFKRFTILVDTNYMRDKLYKWWQNNSIVIPLALPSGINKFSSEAIIKPDEKFCLFVGNIKPHKNLNFLIKFWKENQQKLDLPILYIVGSKELRTVFDIGDSSSMQNIVTFKHNCTDEELTILYESCEFFIFPSLSEGFGLPILEAQHFGALLVSSNYSCLPEVAGDGAIYFDPTNYSSLEKALQSTRNISFKNQILDNAQRNVLKYSWAKSAKYFHQHMFQCYTSNNIND